MHSKGGFTFSDAYNLPVYLRSFYLKRLQTFYKQEADEDNAEHDFDWWLTGVNKCTISSDFASPTSVVKINYFYIWPYTDQTVPCSTISPGISLTTDPSDARL